MAQVYTEQKQAQYTNMSKQHVVDAPDYIGQGLANVSKELDRVAEYRKRAEDVKAAADMKQAAELADNEIKNWTDFDGTSGEQMIERAQSIINDRLANMDAGMRDRFVQNNPRWQELTNLKIKESVVDKEDEHIYLTAMSEIPGMANSVSTYVDQNGRVHMYSDAQYKQNLQSLLNSLTNNPALAKHPERLRVLSDQLTKESVLGRSAALLDAKDFDNAFGVLESDEARRVLNPDDIYSKKAMIAAKKEAYIELQRKLAEEKINSKAENPYAIAYNHMSITNGTSDEGVRATNESVIQLMRDTIDGNMDAVIQVYDAVLSNPDITPVQKADIENKKRAMQEIMSYPKLQRQVWADSFITDLKKRNSALNNTLIDVSSQLAERVAELADKKIINSGGFIDPTKISTEYRIAMRELVDSSEKYYYLLESTDRKIIDDFKKSLQLKENETKRALSAAPEDLVNTGWFGFGTKTHVEPASVNMSGMIDAAILASEKPAQEKSLKEALTGIPESVLPPDLSEFTEEGKKRIATKTKNEGFRDNFVRTVDLLNRTYGAEDDERTPPLGTYKALPLEIAAMMKGIARNDQLREKYGIPNGYIDHQNLYKVIDGLTTVNKHRLNEYADEYQPNWQSGLVVRESNTGKQIRQAFAILGLPEPAPENLDEMVNTLWFYQGEDKDTGSWYSSQGKSHVYMPEDAAVRSAKKTSKVARYLSNLTQSNE